MPAFGVGGFCNRMLCSYTKRVADYDPDNRYLELALLQLDHLSNEDVEMKAPLSELAVFLVVDTNILLHHFDVLAQFVDDIERQQLPLVVILPGAVIYELDGQKNRDRLAWFARRATAWLLEKVKQRKSVKGQAQEETCKATGNWKIRENNAIQNSDIFNDELILDCALYFKRERETILCSADNNLCLSARAQGLYTITPSRQESSREIARHIYGNNVDLSEFAQHRESYKAAAQVGSVVAEEDDSMAVDDEGETWSSEIPVNMLHDAVADHFSRLLYDLVGRVGGDEVRQRTTAEEERNMSRHARRRRPYTEWSLGECVAYLVQRAPVGVQLASPRPEHFLQRAYGRGVRGARPGREWTRRDWEVALENVAKIGHAYNDGVLRESLAALAPHFQSVFS